MKNIQALLSSETERHVTSRALLRPRNKPRVCGAIPRDGAGKLQALSAPQLGLGVAVTAWLSSRGPPPLSAGLGCEPPED